MNLATNRKYENEGAIVLLRETYEKFRLVFMSLSRVCCPGATHVRTSNKAEWMARCYGETRALTRHPSPAGLKPLFWALERCG